METAYVLLLTSPDDYQPSGPILNDIKRIIREYFCIEGWRHVIIHHERCAKEDSTVKSTMAEMMSMMNEERNEFDKHLANFMIYMRTVYGKKQLENSCGEITETRPCEGWPGFELWDMHHGYTVYELINTSIVGTPQDHNSLFGNSAVDQADEACSRPARTIKRVQIILDELPKALFRFLHYNVADQVNPKKVNQFSSN